MAVKAYARRYSQAVFEIALETKELDRWQADLEKIVSVVSDAEVMALLENPKLPLGDKARMLSELLADINPKALNLVQLLLIKGRLGMIADIANGYQRLLDSERGIEPATVTTAVPLAEEDKQKLAERLGAIVGKKVVLESEVAPGLIGGIVARIGGKLLDGSTRSKLLALKRELAGTGR